MTGYARVSVDPESGCICGIDAVGPAAGIIASYQAFLMRQGIGARAYDQFLEVHPMTDGIYPLMKYLAGRLKQDTFP